MASLKLTKKQKKAAAFRERKNQKPQQEDIPEADFPNDLVEGVQLTLETDTPKALAEPELRRKRKRDDSEQTRQNLVDDELKQDKKKKRQKPDVKEPVESKTKSKPGDSSKSRFILFVGNLKYTTSPDAIQEHFSKCDPPPQIRMLTPKPKAPGSAMIKSKGCAFLEFSHKNALQQGLKLHGSTLDGRRINVELTAGGGGKSESRVRKVQERNKQLLEQRKKQIQKKLDAGENADATTVLPPQRHSTTSGVEHAPAKKRTWSVPEHDETNGRGGVKQRGKKNKSSRNWGTGANAITVN